MNRLHFDTVHGLATKALLAGATLKSSTRVHWDISGDCERPRIREVFSRPSKDRHFHGHLKAEAVNSVCTVELEVKCRGCPTCLKRRGQMWRCRAEIEYAASHLRGGRTWFGTLTLRPSEHFRMRLKAIKQFTDRGCDPEADTFEALTEKEQFDLTDSQVYQEFKKFWKRIRKETGAKFRYLVVAERHKSGLVHYHCLVHEHDLVNKVRKETLERQWLLGFSQWRVCNDARAGAYATKYLLKEAGVRVRASGRYGRDAASTTPEGHRGQGEARTPVMAFPPSQPRGGNKNSLNFMTDTALHSKVVGRTDQRKYESNGQVSDVFQTWFERLPVRLSKYRNLKARGVDGGHPPTWFEQTHSSDNCDRSCENVQGNGHSLRSSGLGDEASPTGRAKYH